VELTSSSPTGIRRRNLRLRGPRARSADARRSPGPLGQQWEPLGHFPVYQVLLRGPTKIEYLFLSRSQDPQPPLEPSRDTLPAINTHFWDWIWWLITKASIGRTDLVAEHLPRLYTQLLQPMGISAVPATIESAVEAFVARRDALEQEFGISVDRALEDRGAAGNCSRPGLAESNVFANRRWVPPA
jgi:hypothetical protein